jgi:hypothetical protein
MNYILKFSPLQNKEIPLSEIGLPLLRAPPLQYLSLINFLVYAAFEIKLSTDSYARYINYLNAKKY